MSSTVTREATDSIRGYHYQFDATILSLLELNAGDTLTIEGIEDLDVTRVGLSELYQCKYYENQKLTPSVIRDAILPMFEGFVKKDYPAKVDRKYWLYGHFKGHPLGEISRTIDQLKEIFVKGTDSVDTSGHKVRVKTNLLLTLGATDAHLAEFSKRFTIRVCNEFDEHKLSVKAALKNAFNVSKDEADLYHYPSAFTFVSDLAANHDKATRTISKTQFMDGIKPSQALLNAWTLREVGEAKYCAKLRAAFFSISNVEPTHRLFVVEVSTADTDEDLIDLLDKIRTNWSSHKSRRKPDNERYAPYVYFRGINSSRLALLKDILLQDNVHFSDGYPFQGASFSLIDLIRPQTRDNNLSLRFINSETDLASMLNGITGRLLVFDFFATVRFKLEYSNKHKLVSVPITSLQMILHII